MANIKFLLLIIVVCTICTTYECFRLNAANSIPRTRRGINSLSMELAKVSVFLNAFYLKLFIYHYNTYNNVYTPIPPYLSM